MWCPLLSHSEWRGLRAIYKSASSNWLNPFSEASHAQNLTLTSTCLELLQLPQVPALLPSTTLRISSTIISNISVPPVPPTRMILPPGLSVCSHADSTLNANDAIRVLFVGRLRRSLVVAFYSSLYPLAHRSARLALGSQCHLRGAQ